MRACTVLLSLPNSMEQARIDQEMPGAPEQQYPPGTAVSRYRFRPTIKVHQYGDQVLLWDPTTGSWCFVGREALPLIEGLRYLCDEDSTVQSIESLPDAARKLLDEFVACGLVAENGRYSWSKNFFAHHENKVNTIILKVVGACNIGCTYCYDFDGQRFSKKLDLDTVRMAIDGVWDRSGDHLNVLFHGGEPMIAKDLIFSLVPEIHARAEASGKKIFFSIQTNGTMIDDAWCAFLSRYDFSVGVSLDGDERFNDTFRVTHRGKGTYQQIIDRLRRHNLIDKIGVLTTVTRANVDHLLDIALHFQDLGIELWDTTVFQAAGRGEDQEDVFAPATSSLVDSYLALIEAIEAGRFPTLEVQCILSYVRNVLSYQRTNMCLRTSCGAGADLVSISADGAIEACDCIANPDLRLGTLTSNRSVGAALDSHAAHAIRARHVDRLNPCQNCDWRVVCGGTCLAKAGEVEVVAHSECAVSLALFPAIMESLSKTDVLVDYAHQFAPPAQTA